MDSLVPWNFKHIANPYIRGRLRKAAEEVGFRLPVMRDGQKLWLANSGFRGSDKGGQGPEAAGLRPGAAYSQSLLCICAF